MTTQIFLRRGKEESLLRRHPWIFSGAIASVRSDTPQIEEGEVVDVYTQAGEFIARGHYQIGSIAVRVLTFEREPIDQAWWNRRIAVACDVRRSLGLSTAPDTDCYRLVHGEGDSLPGLVVDIYGSVAVIQCHSVGMYRSRMAIAEALRTAFADRLTAIYDKSSQTVPFKAGLNAVDGYLFGHSDSKSHVVTENGLKFKVNWEEGQKTGFFLDQRENRALLRRYAEDIRTPEQLFEPDDGPVAKRLHLYPAAVFGEKFLYPPAAQRTAAPLAPVRTEGFDPEQLKKEQQLLLDYARLAVTEENVALLARQALAARPQVNAALLADEYPNDFARIIGLHTYSQSPHRDYDIQLTGNWVERGGFRFEDFVLTRRREEENGNH